MEIKQLIDQLTSIYESEGNIKIDLHCIEGDERKSYDDFEVKEFWESRNKVIVKRFSITTSSPAITYKI